MNYILGGGVAGLLAAFYNPDYKIIDSNPMGQLNLPFIPGPRILKRDDLAEKFLTDLGVEYYIEKIKINYTDEFFAKTNLTEDYKKKYSLITRGTDIVEKSFLSSGENEIEILTDGTEQFYFNVFELLCNQLIDRIIIGKIDKINLKNKTISINFGSINKTIPYQKLISTLPLKIFLKLSNFPDDLFNFEVKNKHFMQLAYNDGDREKIDYAYAYGINGDWTRFTPFDNYCVVEMTDKWVENNSEPVKYDQYKVLNFRFNMPIQIQNSIDIQNIGGVKMLGRFAQWNHKIKANEILQTLDNWKNDR